MHSRWQELLSEQHRHSLIDPISVVSSDATSLVGRYLQKVPVVPQYIAMVTGSPPSNARRLRPTALPVSPTLPLHTIMTQTGDQRHSRTRSRRRISIALASSSRSCEDLIIRKTIHVTAVGFVILTAVLVLAVMFDGIAPANGAAPRSDDNHPAGNSKGVILDIPVFKDKIYLRGSQKRVNKRANNDKSGESGEGVTVHPPLRLLRITRDPYTDSIDAASKAIGDVIKNQLVAITAVEEAVNASAGINWGRDSWDA